MTNKDIRRLVDKYLAGETSTREETLLARELLRPGLPQEWQVVRQMLGELTLGEAAYDSIMAKRHGRRRLVVWGRWSAAAAALLLAWFTLYLFPDRQTETEPVLTEQTAQPVKPKSVPASTLAFATPTATAQQPPCPVTPKPKAVKAKRKIEGNGKSGRELNSEKDKQMTNPKITIVYEPLFREEYAQPMAEEFMGVMACQETKDTDEDKTSLPEEGRIEGCDVDALLAEAESIGKQLREHRIRLRHAFAGGGRDLPISN